MAGEATDDRVYSVLIDHMRQTEDQVERLQMVFDELDAVKTRYI